MADVKTEALREFIESQRKQRGMNPTQFAKFIGVSHTTIGRASDPRYASTPSPELLYKLALKTGVNLSALIALVMPDVETVPIDAQSLIRAQRIRQLPADKQDAIDEIILGMLLSDSK